MMPFRADRRGKRGYRSLLQPALHLEAPRRRDVLQIDSPEALRYIPDGFNKLVTSFVSTQMGKASTPANSLKRTHFLHDRHGGLGPMSPSPSTALPSV
jgi:hypothetical protein